MNELPKNFRWIVRNGQFPKYCEILAVTDLSISYRDELGVYWNSRFRTTQMFDTFEEAITFLVHKIAFLVHKKTLTLTAAKKKIDKLGALFAQLKAKPYSRQ